MAVPFHKAAGSRSSGLLHSRTFGVARGIPPAEAPGHAMSDARIYPIWDGLVSFRPGQLEEATQYLMAQLCQLIRADHSVWAGALRRPDAPVADPYGGWRSTAARLPLAGAPDRCDPTITMRTAEAPDPLSAALVRGAGTFRALRLCDAMSSEWLADAYAQLEDPEEAIDGVLVAFPVHDYAESWFVFTRSPRLPRFSEHERELLGEALRGLRWFHRRLLLWHGIIPSRSLLTVTERRVLCHALDGASDKEVAVRLASGVHTTREHIAALYKKFGVSSRAELLALWLGGDP
jgi:DNA-binding CsgD family transcriptional regulator